MKTTSQKIRRTFITAAAVLFAAPLTVQAGNFSEIAAEVLDASCNYGDVVKCDYTVRINDDPALSHLNLELPEGAEVVSPADVSIGKDGSVKGTEYEDTVYVKWDKGQEVGEENVTTYTVEFDNVPEGAGAGWTCEMGFKASTLYSVTEVPGPCTPPDVASAAVPTLQVKYSDDTECHDLIAGQHIVVGNVCVTLDETQDNLLIRYSTVPEEGSVSEEFDEGWELVEAQLWTGLQNDVENPLPANKKGNPKIGNFPYLSEQLVGDITGDTFYEVEVPILETFGDLKESVCGSEVPVSVAADVAAHATVRKYNDLTGYQTETGWANGDPITEGKGGSWAMMPEIKFVCE